MITLTPTATEKIKSSLEKRGHGVGIRIGVKTTGCSGLAYVLEYVDDEALMAMSHYDVNDVKIFVALEHRVYLHGLTVDYVKKGLNEGFEFINPNEKDRCGCGESFRV
jgi:iron-sulfur cluster assembly protein